MTSVEGDFGSPSGTAYVATRMGDIGGCPELGFQTLAVDASGDGMAEASYGPLECERPCFAFAAPDVDADGQSEIAVVVDGGDPVAFELYRVVGNAGPQVTLIPIQTVEDAGGLTRSLWLWSGQGWFEEGSAGYRSYCVTGPGRVIPPPGFVNWSATLVVDRYLVSESAYSFNEDGNLAFVTRRESAVPFGASDRLPPGSENELCGAAVKDPPDDG